MRSEILSSNFDLLNLGAARRSLFGGGNSSNSSRMNERNNNHSTFSNIPQPRRQTKRSQSHPGPPEAQNQPSTSKLSGRRPLGLRTRAAMDPTADSSSSSLPSRPPRPRAASNRTRSAAAAVIADAESTCNREEGGSSPTNAGTKRKRPSLTKTRSSTGLTSRAASYKTSQEVSNISAPLSQSSTSSIRSVSGSEDSIGSHLSRRTSKSSSSIRRGLGDLVIGSQSVATSPTRSKTDRRRSSLKDTSLSPQSLADTTVVSRRTNPRQASGSWLLEDAFSDEDGDHLSLDVAPSWQLERLRKDRLVALSAKVGLPYDGLTRAQLIEGLDSYRDDHPHQGSLHDLQSSSHSPRAHRKRSFASKRSMSSQSADYTDESDQSLEADEAGHEGGGEETEAEGLAGAAASRKRRPLPRDHIEDLFGESSASNKGTGSRKVRGVRSTRLMSPRQPAANGCRNIEPPAGPTPILHRLRHAKSIQFAASSPARVRARTRGSQGITRGPATSALPDPSPIKSRLRKAKSAKHIALGRSLRGPSPMDEEMDHDWVDSGLPVRHLRRKGSHRKAKTAAQQRLNVPLDDADMTSGDEAKQRSEEDAESESEEEAHAASFQTDGEARNGDDESEEDDVEEDDPGEATEREDDRQDGSDATDVPDEEEADHYDGSSGSPSKMRRLRNGKVRIKPTVQVHDGADGAGPSLRPLKSISAPRTAQGGRVKAVKTKPPTPPLSESNTGANSAGPENLDELNGLDLESLNLTDKEIPARQLEKHSRIGSGGFKDVFVGIWKVGKRRNKVAIADIREKLTEMDIKELGLLRDLKHENIVRFIGVSIPEDTAKTGIPCMIVSELCANGDLWDYIRNVKPPPDLQIFRMLLETAKGLEYLHMHSIVHRDVKSSNVLVTRNRSCKINDFGLARVKTSQRSKMKSVVGTINWQAVELWCRQPQYNEKVDVWSTAMTFWETLQWYEDYKSYPFEGMNDFVIYEEVGKEGKRPPTDKIAMQFGDEIVKLLSRMWDTDPRKRPTMDMVCKDLERLIEVKEMEMDQ